MPYECWTDDSGEALKDKLLKHIVENNPSLPIVNPDWN